MENKIEIHNMNLHYGDFHALHDINLDIIGKSDHSVYRTVRLRQVYLSENTQPHERSGAECTNHMERCGSTARISMIRRLMTTLLRKTCRHGISAAEPVPDEYL